MIMRAMLSFASSLWPARLAALLVAALAAAGATYWVLQWQALRLQAPALAVDSGSAPVVDSSAVARALGAPAPQATAGAAPVAAAITTRLALTGVVAARTGSGAALISVDGKPAKAFQVGATVVEDWQVRSVQPRSVNLAQGGAAGAAQAALELPTTPQAPPRKAP